MPASILVENAVEVCGVSTRRLFCFFRPASRLERTGVIVGRRHSEGVIE
jgi:hypothetical protein